MSNDISRSFRSLDPNSSLETRAKESNFFDKAKQKARRVTIGDRQFYVLEGDLLMDDVQLAEYAIRKTDDSDTEPVVEDQLGGGTSKLLAVARNGKIVRWELGKVLTYYIAKETFSPEQYIIVRDSIRDATEDWMKVCGIQFEYQPQLDTNNTKRNDALFSVRFLDAGGAFIAAAFFPDDPPARRIVVIDPSFFIPGLLFNKVGVLRHELGHVLGFRHEHIRSGAPAGCPGEPLFDTIDLTKYDPTAVMHYFCGGVGNKELEITNLDREGARRVYGLPISTFNFV